MRLIAVGDIHGHLEKLETLMAQVKPIRADQVVFLGDYIDRGPDSKGVIDYLIRFAELFPKTGFIQGNHERMMLDALALSYPDRLPDWKRLDEIEPGHLWEIRIGGPHDIWLKNGGWQCLKSYGATEEDREEIASDGGWYNVPDRCWSLIPQSHVDFLAKSKLWHRQDGFLFVHAGAHVEGAGGRPLEEQMLVLLWERYAPRGRTETHVVGHTPTPDGEPYFEEGRYNLDTGAAYEDGKLTACDVLTKEFWQA